MTLQKMGIIGLYLRLLKLDTLINTGIWICKYTGTTTRNWDDQTYDNAVTKALAIPNAHLTTSAEWATIIYMHYTLYYNHSNPKAKYMMNFVSTCHTNINDFYYPNGSDWNVECPDTYENSYGHAIYETSSASTGSTAWFGGWANFPTSGTYLCRSGNYLFGFSRLVWN